MEVTPSGCGSGVGQISHVYHLSCLSVLQCPVVAAWLLRQPSGGFHQLPAWQLSGVLRRCRRETAIWSQQNELLVEVDRVE